MNCVREMTSKELIEESSIENKDLILSRMKEEYCRMEERIKRYDDTMKEQMNVIMAYRTVLKDMIYSNWLNG